MDLGSLLLIIALALAAAVILMRPILNPALYAARQHDNQAEDQRHSVLLAERERLLAALQELDFDLALGKVPAEDYPEHRDRLRMQGAQVLHELDMLGVDVKGTIAGLGAMVDEKDDEVENLIAARRRARSEKAAGFCPKCGTPAKKSDKFCSRCGKPF